MQIYQKVKEKLQQFGRNLCGIITQNKKEDPLYIPVLPQFMKLVKIQMPKWVESATQARFLYKGKEQYVVKEDDKRTKLIAPVDQGNNGEVQDSSVWGNGLHQFLQLKENIEITCESFMTNFLSNKAYFQMYENRVLGLSGTMGSPSQQKFLQNSLRFQTHKIDRLHYDKFILEEPIITPNQQSWQNSIIQRAIALANNRRPVVVICPTIKKAERIFYLLQLSNRKFGSTFLYTRNDSCQSVSVRYVFKPGDILVLTNLTGRGTDIKLSKQSSQNGGLHVIVGFMPKNQRVYWQNLRRAARQGGNGSGQLIIDTERLSQLCHNKGYQEIKKICWGRQDFLLQDFIQKNQKIMDLKTIFFEQFCKKRQQILLQLKNEHRQNENAWNPCFLYLDLFWALFLKEEKFDQKNKEATIKKFKSVLAKINARELLQNLIKNPTQCILRANQLEKSIFLKPISPILNKLFNGPKLVQLYQKAILLGIENGYQDWIVYYKAGYGMIKYKQSGCQFLALEYLKKALQILTTKQIPQVIARQQILMQFSSDFVNSQLRLQLKNSFKILISAQESIQANIEVVEQSLKLVDVCFSSDNMLDTFSKKSLQNNEAQKILMLNQGQNKQYKHFNSIRFHSLSGRQGVLDQSKAYSLKKKAEELNIGGVWNLIFPIKSKFMAIQDLPQFYSVKQKQLRDDAEGSNTEGGFINGIFEYVNEKVNWANEKVKQKILAKISENNKVIGQIASILELGKEGLDKAKQVYKSGQKVLTFIAKQKQNMVNWWKDIKESSKIPVTLTIYQVDQPRVAEILQKIRTKIITSNEQILQLEAVFLKTQRQFDKNKSVTKIQVLEKVAVKYTLNSAQIIQESQKKPNSVHLKEQNSVLSQNIRQPKPNYVQFKGISQKLAYQILNQCKNQDEVILKYGNISLEQLKMIGKLHKEVMNNIIIEVTNINQQQALTLLQTGILRIKNHVQIRKTVPIRNLFSLTKAPSKVIEEYQRNGLNQLYFMSQVKSIPKDTIFIAMGAIAQFGLSFAFSGGAIPSILISNACFDLIFAAKCAMNRQIDLQDFLIKKGINLTLAVASALTSFACGAKMCTDAMNGSHLVSGLQHLVHLVKAQLIFKGSQWAFLKLLDNFRSQLRSNIEKNVRKAFSCHLIRRTLQIDTKNNDHNNFRKIIEIISKQKTKIQSQSFNKFMSQTSQAFVSASSSCNHTYLSKIQLLIGVGNSLKQYLQASDEICTSIINKIEKITKTVQDNDKIDSKDYEIECIVAAVSQIIEDYIVETIRTNIIDPASAIVSYNVSSWSMGKLRNFMKQKFNVQGLQTTTGNVPLGSTLIPAAAGAAGVKISACVWAFAMIILTSFLMTILKIPVNIASKLFQ